MTLRGDDRAVAVQIGAVILLGFLMISLSLYQATVVPNENREVEFQHNQRVQSDMLEVRNAILGTAATGSASPAAVELGTQYPTRAVAINPSPPSGTLSTSSLGTVQVRNAVADDAATTEPDYPETADFWNGTTQNYTTKSLEYRPSYANYDNAPTTVYENGLVYNRFRSGNVTRSGQPVVAGTRISLVALSGNLSRGGTSSLVVDPEAVSVSTRTISVTNESAGENVSVVVPSELGGGFDQRSVRLRGTEPLRGCGTLLRVGRDLPTETFEGRGRTGRRGYRTGIPDERGGPDQQSVRQPDVSVRGGVARQVQQPDWDERRSRRRARTR